MKYRYPTRKALAAALRAKSSQPAATAATSKPRGATARRRSASQAAFPICYHHFL